jgi:hypothetical protein
MKHFIHAIVDAPVPPDWLLDQAKNIDRTTQAEMNNWGTDYTQRDLYHPTGVYNNAFNHSIYLDDAALAWTRENVTPEAKDIRISWTYPGLARCGAHIDRTRNYTLLYLLETGGDNHETVFYQEQDVDELYRPHGYHVDDYGKLTRIAGAKLQVGRWHLLQARILHSIENISRGRRSIQVSLDAWPFVDNQRLSEDMYLDRRD